MKIIWSPLALEQINEIVDYIAQENPKAAERTAIELFSAVERLEKFSESERIVPELSRSNIREIILRKYRILYRIEAKQISILTVRHARQHLQSDDIV